jgi:predicted permease
MDTFLFAVDAILPIMLLIALGYILKKLKFFSKEFLSRANKLCFAVMLPVLLFHNTYSIDNLAAINWAFIGYGVGMLLAITVVAFFVIVATEKDNSKRGVLLQCVFRSNYAIIGIPLATSLFGIEGSAAATLLSAFTIPVFNILAVIALSIFPKPLETLQNSDYPSASPVTVGSDALVTPKSSDQPSAAPTATRPSKYSAAGIIKGIVTNPLILGVAIGLICLAVRELFKNWGVEFRLYNMKWFKTTVGYLANTATPVALLVLGGQFELNVVARLKKQIVIGTVARCVFVPLIGLGVAYLFFPTFGGEYFASYIALFATPVAVSSAIMAQEMGGDGDLAGQLVVWTTLCSAVTLFIAIVLFRAIGIF